MATQAIDGIGGAIRLKPAPVDRALSAVAIALFAVVIVAMIRGAAHWDAVSPVVWAHMAAVLTALALTPVMLLRRRGDHRHRQLGYVWVTALTLTALVSFAIRGMNDGRLSLIHLLSAWTLWQLLGIVRSARTHRVVDHRRHVRLMTAGALLIAGGFTLIPGRLLGHWLIG